MLQRDLIILLLLSVTMIAVCDVVLNETPAQEQYANMRIAFQSDRDGNEEIYVMNADGSNPVNLTENPESDGSFAWHPDGTGLAFVLGSGGKGGIHLMNADGTGVINLTKCVMGTSVSYGIPTWSPDGMKIAFGSGRDSESKLYVVEAGASDIVNLTRDLATVQYPVWSPDGEKIVFMSKPTGKGDWDICVVSPDGSDLVNITSSPVDDRYPAWSPDGKKIAFMSRSQRRRWDMYIVNSDGSNLVNITRALVDGVFLVGGVFPAWSPDGKKIMFLGNSTSDQDGGYGICVMNSDGSNPVNLTRNPGIVDYYPVWSPDGKKIAFMSKRDGNKEIYVMNADGSDPVNLTNNPAGDSYPMWLPTPSAAFPGRDMESVWGNWVRGREIETLVQQLRTSGEELRHIGEPAVPALIRILKYGEPGDRNEASNVLRNIGEPAVAPLIEALLNDEDAEVRRHAARALPQMGNPDNIPGLMSAIPALTKALREEDKGVRASAATGLQNMGTNIRDDVDTDRRDAAVAALIEALGDEDSEVRSSALMALSTIPVESSKHAEAAVPALTRLLEDQGITNRDRAAWMLGRIGEPDKAAVSTLIAALNDQSRIVRDRAAVALGQIGDLTAVPALIETLDDESMDIRVSSAEALVRMGEPAATPALIQLLGNVDITRRGSSNMRRAAVRALAQTGDSSAVPVLLRMLGDESAWVGVSAAIALVEIDDSKTDTVIPVLIEALGDSVPDARSDAVDALVQIGKPAVTALVDALSIENTDARINAARALARIENSRMDLAVPILIHGEAIDALEEMGDPAIPMLIDMLDDGSVDARVNAAEALARIGNPPAEMVIPVLIEALRDENQSIRLRAARALDSMGESAKDAVPALMQLLNDERPGKGNGVRKHAIRTLGKMGPAAKEAIPLLIGILKGKNAIYYGDFEYAISSLAEIGEPAVPALIDALRYDEIWPDSRHSIAWMAARALADIGDPAVPALTKALTVGYTRYSAANALFMMGEPARDAIPALIQALNQDSSPRVRRKAARALGRIGEPVEDVVPVLIQALQDEAEDVRFYAVYALREIGTPEAMKAAEGALQQFWSEQ